MTPTNRAGFRRPASSYYESNEIQEAQRNPRRSYPGTGSPGSRSGKTRGIGPQARQGRQGQIQRSSKGLQTSETSREGSPQRSQGGGQSFEFPEAHRPALTPAHQGQNSPGKTGQAPCPSAWRTRRGPRQSPRATSGPCSSVAGCPAPAHPSVFREHWRRLNRLACRLVAPVNNSAARGESFV